METSGLAEGVRTASDFLDDHWVLKWFVVPIVLMASVLLSLFVGVSTATPVEGLQVVAVFVALSLGVVAVGLLVERAVAQFTGFELFHHRKE